MAETFVENSVCSVCRADIRPHALFCYDCGASVASKAESADKNGISNNADLFINIISDGEKVKSEKPLTITEKIPAPEVIDEKSKEKVFVKEDSKEKVKLKSAASLRRKSKIIQPKKIEISWEASENAPNKWFIVVALGITLFAAGVLFLALQLR